MNVIASVFREAIPKCESGDCFVAECAPRNDTTVFSSFILPPSFLMGMERLELSRVCSPHGPKPCSSASSDTPPHGVPILPELWRFGKVCRGEAFALRGWREENILQVANRLTHESIVANASPLLHAKRNPVYNERGGVAAGHSKTELLTCHFERSEKSHCCN